MFNGESQDVWGRNHSIAKQQWVGVFDLWGLEIGAHEHLIQDGGQDKKIQSNN